MSSRRKRTHATTAVGSADEQSEGGNHAPKRARCVNEEPTTQADEEKKKKREAPMPYCCVCLNYRADLVQFRSCIHLVCVPCGMQLCDSDRCYSVNGVRHELSTSKDLDQSQVTVSNQPIAPACPMCRSGTAHVDAEKVLQPCLNEDYVEWGTSKHIDGTVKNRMCVYPQCELYAGFAKTTTSKFIETVLKHCNRCPYRRFSCSFARRRLSEDEYSLRLQGLPNVPGVWTTASHTCQISWTAHDLADENLGVLQCLEVAVKRHLRSHCAGGTNMFSCKQCQGSGTLPEIRLHLERATTNTSPRSKAKPTRYGCGNTKLVPLNDQVDETSRTRILLRTAALATDRSTIELDSRICRIPHEMRQFLTDWFS